MKSSERDPRARLATGIIMDQEPVVQRRPPFFHDVTLRDGNQALKKPWSIEEKVKVFNLLQKLGVQGVEVGYPGASEMDFAAAAHLAGAVPRGMAVTMLARTNKQDIAAAARALASAYPTNKRIHIFVGMSEYHMAEVLKMNLSQVEQLIYSSAADALEVVGVEGDVQFSPEHFGDCLENLSWVIGVFQKLYGMGVRIFNLPTTVDRYPVRVYQQMVKAVVNSLPEDAVVSAHCHNDIGLGTANTTEAYFNGASQLEVTLNGLGERAGNTSLYETAMVLYNAGVEVPLDFTLFYETALAVAEISGVVIPEKAALIGADCLMQRSGIHQHGAFQTFGRAKGAYRPCDPELIGRAGDEQMEFTSQSGYTAVLKLLQEAGMNISKPEARILQPAFKLVSESRGALTIDQLVEGYEAYKHLCAHKSSPPAQTEINAIVHDAIGILGQRTWEYREVVVVSGTVQPTATVCLTQDGKALPAAVALGNGPVNAAFNAIAQITGLDVVVIDYAIDKVEGGSNAVGKAKVVLCQGNNFGDGQGADTDIVVASVKAYVDALNNLLYNQQSRQVFPPAGQIISFPTS